MRATSSQPPSGDRPRPPADTEAAFHERAGRWILRILLLGPAVIALVAAPFVALLGTTVQTIGALVFAAGFAVIYRQVKASADARGVRANAPLAGSGE